MTEPDPKTMTLPIDLVNEICIYLGKRPLEETVWLYMAIREHFPEPDEEAP